MMKANIKISKWSISVLLVLITISCNDFLDKNPLDSMSSQEFWASKADVETGLAGVYSRLQNNFLGYERVYFDGLTDNAYADGNTNEPNIALMTTGGISPVLSGAIVNMYSAPYRAITSCNFFLDNVDKAPLTAAELDVYKAEVRFIRAMSYFDLVRLFGDVIIYKNYFKTLDEANIAKSPKADVYALIEDDLNFAISKLPDTKYTGRAVMGSAQGLLGTVLLTQEKWTDAAAVLKQVIDGGKFQLSDNYRELFTPAGQLKANVNREIMFSTRYLAPNNVQKASPVGGMNIELGWYLIMQPYKDLVNAYQMTDGLAPGASPLDSTGYINRDPRLDITVRLPAEIWKDQSGNPWDDKGYTRLTGGFRMEKYMDLSKIPFTNTTATTTDQDMIYLRYADILLMYAEAKNEATGPDASVYDAIKQVRARTGINMPAVDQGVYDTKSELRDYIRNERRVELALEGHRYFDLKRWRMAHIKLPTMKNAVGTQMVFDEKHYFLPFTQSELDNNKKLEQSDLWK